MSDRSFNARIGSTLSDTFEQEQGVPQGSIISPTLFNIKINNIVKCVNDTDSSLYVDEFGIFYKSKNMENIEFRLQRCLNKVETWATENGFRFSKTKTQCVHFFQLRGLHPDPVLNIYGSPIPVVEEAKFLGLLFDKKLSFISHIKALKAKCLKALDVLKVLSNTNWGGDRSVLLNLYRSLVRSKQCIWLCTKIIFKKSRHHSSSGFTSRSWSVSYFFCRKSLCRIERTIFIH